jgi:hypothetical protein
VLDVLRAAENAAVEYVPEDAAERAEMVSHGTSQGRPVGWHPFVNPGTGEEEAPDEDACFAAACDDAEELLRDARWEVKLRLKGSAEAAGWFREARERARRARGALLLVAKLIAAVKVPDDIEDEVEDVLRLSVLVLGEGGE